MHTKNNFTNFTKNYFLKTIKIYIIFLLTLVLQHLHAQTIFNSIGGNAAAMAGIGTLNNDVYSVQNNQAGLAEIKNYQIGVFNTIPFAVKNLSLVNISAALPTKYFTAGIAISQFGYRLFNQQRITTAMAKQLSNEIFLGAAISYIGTNIAEQPHIGNFVGELGLIYQPNNKLSLAMNMFNPTMIKYGNGLSDRIPSFIRTGIRYKIGKDLIAGAEFDKSLNQPENYKASIQYKAYPSVNLMCGWALLNNQFTLGSDIKYKNCQFIFATGVNQILGLTPSVSINYNFK